MLRQLPRLELVLSGEVQGHDYSEKTSHATVGHTDGVTFSVPRSVGAGVKERTDHTP